MDNTKKEALLKNTSTFSLNAVKLSARANFQVEYIDIEKIKPSEKNFYHVADIENLANGIEQNGLLHNIVLRKMDNDMYEIVSGERRFTAYKYLCEKKGDAYKFIPAKIEELNDLDAELELIQANSQVRTLSPAEILHQVERLKVIYDTKRAKGEIVIGATKNIIAKDLGMGTTQVAKYQKIANKLEPDVKEDFTKGDITLTEALELTNVPKADQAQFADAIKNNKVIMDEPKVVEYAKAKPNVSVAEYSRQPSKPAHNGNLYKYSYLCPNCGAEVYSNYNIKIRCEKCDELFILGEL